MPPKRRDGTERRRAREATHTVVWRTWAQIIRENVTYFEHRQKERISVWNQGAPNVTHSERFGTGALWSASIDPCHVVKYSSMEK